VDGQTWDDVVKDDLRKVVATPNIDEAQVWELESLSRGWFDPLRIHLICFKILDRDGKPPSPGNFDPRTSPTRARTRRCCG
jgi:spore coat protein A